jgi:hypothetical protein
MHQIAVTKAVKFPPILWSNKISVVGIWNNAYITMQSNVFVLWFFYYIQWNGEQKTFHIIDRWYCEIVFAATVIPIFSVAKTKSSTFKQFKAHGSVNKNKFIFCFELSCYSQSKGEIKVSKAINAYHIIWIFFDLLKACPLVKQK